MHEFECARLLRSTRPPLQRAVKHLKRTTPYCIESQKRPAADATLQSFPRIVSARAKVSCSIQVSSGRESFLWPKLPPDERCSGHLRDESAKPWRWLA